MVECKVLKVKPSTCLMQRISCMDQCKEVVNRHRQSSRTVQLKSCLRIIPACCALRMFSGFAGFYDYGPLGVEMKNNIKKIWWRDMVHRRDDMVCDLLSIALPPRASKPLLLYSIHFSFTPSTFPKACLKYTSTVFSFSPVLAFVLVDSGYSHCACLSISLCLAVGRS